MSIRSFVALPIPGKIREHLAWLHESVPHTAGRITWVKPEAIHLTCVFLGDIEEDQVDTVTSALETAVTGMESFVTCLDGVGAFPNFRNPRTVWVGYDEGASEVMTLKCSVDEALKPLGFEPEKRTFYPHVTLGRVKQRGNPKELEKAAASWVLPFENWITRNMILFQSELTKHGPIYTPLARIPMSDPGSSVERR
ncbi:RNA 2',3'-cyclic phosphodiesterase [Candidatus Zixiibacteriota bacterium]